MDLWLAVPLLVALLPVAAFVAAVLAHLAHIYATSLRLSFTDLARVPEPPTTLYQRLVSGHHLAYFLLKADSFASARRFDAWHRAYGPIYVVRGLFGLPSVVVHSDDAIRHITVARPANYLKSRPMRDSLASLIGHHGILLAEAPAHARLRRAVAPALRHDALLRVSAAFLAEGNALAARLAEPRPDVLRHVRISAFRIIFQTCFGARTVPEHVVSRLTDAYLAVLVEPPAHMQRRFLLQSFFHFIPAHTFGYREHLKRFIRATVAQLYDQFHAAPSAEPTLLSMMVDEETNQAISRPELVDTVLSFLAAGQATSSISVCWTLYALAAHPHWQQRLHQELSSWTEADGLDALDRLDVLHRVIRESLRLYPPVFFTSRVLAQDDEIHGYLIPKGTVVRIPIHAVQRSRHIWGDDAEQFNPDRWLKQDATKRFYECAFLFGVRGCIGQRFAMLEMKSFVALVVKKLRLSVKPLDDPPPWTSGAFATPRDMRIYFDPRS